MAVQFPSTVIGGVHGGAVLVKEYGEVAAASTTAIHAALAVLATGGPQVVTTGITQPDVPRNVTATAGGTAGDIKAVQVTVTGKNVAGETITETLPAFTVDTPGTVVGSKAFASIDSYSVPAMDGTGATVALGTGSKLGLPNRLGRNSVLHAFFDDVKEGTDPTVAVNADDFEANTVTLNSALDGSSVTVAYYLS